MRLFLGPPRAREVPIRISSAAQISESTLYSQNAGASSGLWGMCMGAEPTGPRDEKIRKTSTWMHGNSACKLRSHPLSSLVPLALPTARTHWCQTRLWRVCGELDPGPRREGRESRARVQVGRGWWVFQIICRRGGGAGAAEGGLRDLCHLTGDTIGHS